jgi:hypothetical protein
MPGFPRFLFGLRLSLFYMRIAIVKRGRIWRLPTSKMAVVNSLFYISIAVLSLVAMNFSGFKDVHNFSRLVLYQSSGKNYLSEGRAVYYDGLLNAGYGYDRVNEQFLFDCRTGPIYQKRPEASEKEASQLYKGVSGVRLGELVDSEFYNVFDDLNERTRITRKIRLIVPAGAGIITPPYLNCFREFLPQYDIYFQEHDDGNFMLGAKQIYAAFLHRMTNLGIEYSDLPTQSSGLNIDIMRRIWLNLSNDDYSNITIQEPKFKYILTEASHSLNFKVIYQNETWSLYQIQ